MDARVPIERLLGLEEGDAHVIRNAGALVTDDVLRSLELSRSLGTEAIALVLHTDCGVREGDLDAAAREAAAEIAGRVSQFDGGVRGYVYDVEARDLREVHQAEADRRAG
jgi:carbonic anhydrase